MLKKDIYPSRQQAFNKESTFMLYDRSGKGEGFRHLFLKNSQEDSAETSSWGS